MANLMHKQQDNAERDSTRRLKGITDLDLEGC